MARRISDDRMTDTQTITPLFGLQDYLLRFWDMLTLPRVAIQDAAARRRARLLLAMLVMVLVAGFVTFISELVQVPTLFSYDIGKIHAIGLLVTLGAYLVARTVYLEAGTILVITVSFIVFIVVPFAFYTRDSLLYFAIIPTLFTAMFFNTRITSVVAVSTIVAPIALDNVVPDSFVEPGYIAEVIQFLVLANTIILVFMWHVQAMENIRNRELSVANARLRASEQALERRVQERTEELAASRDEIEKLLHEQIEVSETLREADLIKSQFLASMSHELRTPLNAILNFTEFVARGMLGPVTERQEDALNKTLDSGKHLLSLINDVLDITKIEAGMMTLFKEENIDLTTEIDSVVATTETILKDKSVTFNKDIDPALPRITADKRRLRQVMLNLTSNAAKFTEEGSVTLSVKKHNDVILIAVIDTGPGIDPAQHNVIFEPFRQTEMGISHANGTGLGLPISKWIAEAHGGKLWVESEPGDGAAFYMTLPISLAQ